ncbi:hypothetical protein LJR175_003120 [Variovorax sp. LjRoot175]|uniref:hypothetical protein n=1 Tax=Variovorax sp. LjRoot175 TaxID=3342276 RepID=UPI003ECF37CE
MAAATPRQIANAKLDVDFWQDLVDKAKIALQREFDFQDVVGANSNYEKLLGEVRRETLDSITTDAHRMLIRMQTVLLRLQQQR